MTKQIRWSAHALKELNVREIDSVIAEDVAINPVQISLEQGERKAMMKLYHDEVLNKEMLLRVIVEESEIVTTIITLYKTSQIEKSQ